MGLFSKKKEVPKGEAGSPATITPVPEFPDMPEEEFPEFPSYEPTVEDIKSEVDKGSEDFEIPVREPQPRKLPAADMRSMPADGKPLFVQINKYKDVLSTIEAIKSRLGEAENLLNNFESMKEEEDRKMESLRKDLEAVKDKLLSIDKDLFEV